MRISTPKFRTIWQNPSPNPILGIGVVGEDTESRAAHKQLSAFWKNTDSDLPVLLQAKIRYSTLRMMIVAVESAGAFN